MDTSKEIESNTTTKNKVCYVCCVYLGNRRCSVPEYDEDRTSYVREQVNSLSEFSHNLDKIIFVFNLEESHRSIFERCKEIIPRRIGTSPVEILERENIGMSYGAWSDCFSKFKSEFDYYIFNEDDYFVNDHNFDSYLVNKFKSHQNIGYLCAVVTNPVPEKKWPVNQVHASNSFGISSYKVLSELYEKFGKLPHAEGSTYEENEINGQISQTNEIFNLGYDIFDIRDDYAVFHYIGDRYKSSSPDFDHFVEYFFPWNDKFLISCVADRFKHRISYTKIVDQQYQRKRSCYIINFYFGPRRRTIEEYKNDPLCFLKKHIELLSYIPHNLNKIIFNFNVDPLHYEYLNLSLQIIPKKINNSEVEISVRENIGLSYGAFSDNFRKNRSDFDYFIFNEDDYFPVEKNWDEYLIRKYNSLPDSGYLSAMVRERDEWNKNRRHAGHCFGISSTKNLNLVFQKYGNLPHYMENNNYRDQEEAQIKFTYSFEEIGLNNYDIREEYRLSFARTEPNTEDIWRWFWWNDKDLIVPALVLFDHPYSWYESFDGPCIKRSNL